MVFLIIGKDCSGKTFFREYVGDKLHMITYEASDYIKKPKKLYNINSTRELLDKIGEDYVAREISSLIESNNQSNDNIAISGFRTLQEVDYISNIIGQENIKIVVVEANDILCYFRNIKRNRDDKQIKLKNFKLRQEEDAKLGFKKIIEKYDTTTITNNSSMKKFTHSIDKYIDSVLVTENQVDKNGSFRDLIKANVNSIKLKIENNNIDKVDDLSIEK